MSPSLLESRFAPKLASWLPAGVKKQLRKHVSFSKYDARLATELNPYADITHSDVNTYNSPYKFGVLKEELAYHKHWMGALLDMGIPFQVFDPRSQHWLQEIQASDCDIFLFWPSAHSSALKNMYNERAFVVNKVLEKPIFPTYHEILLYENKKLQADWLAAHGFPVPETRVFYDYDELMDFATHCDLPIVYKTSLGAVSSGVVILRNRKKLISFLKKAFKHGYWRTRSNPIDRQWGYAILQEFLPNVREWRMIRIGHEYYGYEKIARGDFHSGSHLCDWGRPPDHVLELLYTITETGHFRSIDLDMFLKEDQSVVVNELQSVFGEFPYHKLKINDQSGRLRYQPVKDDPWVFEPGDYAQNSLCNARLRYLIESRFAG